MLIVKFELDGKFVAILDLISLKHCAKASTYLKDAEKEKKANSTNITGLRVEVFFLLFCFAFSTQLDKIGAQFNAAQLWSAPVDDEKERKKEKNDSTSIYSFV